MAYPRKWLSALSGCRSKPTRGSKSTAVWSTTNRTPRKCTRYSIGAERACLEKGPNMSVQFGRWNFDGKPVDREYVEKANACIAPYGPDGAGAYTKNNIAILHHAFHTT